MAKQFWTALYTLHLLMIPDPLCAMVLTVYQTWQCPMSKSWFLGFSFSKPIGKMKGISFLELESTMCQTGLIKKTNWFPDNPVGICRSSTLKRKATFFKLPFFWRRVYTNEYGVICRFLMTPGHDPDPGPQEKPTKKSCVSFETECNTIQSIHM